MDVSRSARTRWSRPSWRSVDDFQRLADEASSYAAEKADAEIGDRRIALHILRWLGEEGFLKPEEAGFFRRR